MLISALCKYYDTLASNELLIKEGYSLVNVSYRIMLNPDGSIEEIQRCTRTEIIDDKKGKEKSREIPMECVMPKRSEKPGIDFNICEHRPLYIFGLAVEEKDKTKLYSESTKAQKSHDLFKKKSIEYTEGMSSPIVQAFRAFVKSWEPAKNIDNSILLDIIKDYEKCGYCFALSGHPEAVLHNDKELLEKYDRSYHETDDSSADIGMCSITGLSEQRIERIHGKIRGIRGGLTTGTSLACFNNCSDESYGKKQSVNSCISVNAARKYVETLNWMLREKSHHTYIDDMTMIYWADTNDKVSDNAMCEFFDLFCSEDSEREEADKKLSAILAKARIGERFSDCLAENGVNTSVDFYVACFTSNASRICLKYVYKNTIGCLADNVVRHQNDLYHSGLKENSQISVGALVKELYPPVKASNKSPSYPLYVAIMESVLNDTLYPQLLLSMTIQKCRTDSGKYAVSSIRIAIIKACLNRKARLANKKEVIPMALDTENNSQAYLCGRLFALLERAQTAALGDKLNKTIKDSYFASACTKPSTVFPRLILLAQHHLEKAEYGGYLDKLICEAASKLDGRFPSTLTLDEQGEFIVGYYQQKQSFYTKNNNKE